LLLASDFNTPQLCHPAIPDRSQSQALDKRNEISIGKQQGVSLFYVKYTDDDFGGFANGDPRFLSAPNSTRF
jgi:hypothetical protein